MFNFHLLSVRVCVRARVRVNERKYGKVEGRVGPNV